MYCSDRPGDSYNFWTEVYLILINILLRYLLIVNILLRYFLYEKYFDQSFIISITDLPLNKRLRLT